MYANILSTLVSYNRVHEKENTQAQESSIAKVNTLRV